MSEELLKRLLPAGASLPARALAEEARTEMRAGPVRPYVYVNMVATVDGRAALHGSTRGLGGAVDAALLLELRAVADAVLVGTGTLATEGYDRLVRSAERRARRLAAGRAEDPPCVVVTRSGSVPWDAGLFAAAEQPVIVFAPAPPRVPPSVRAPVEVVRAGGVREALRQLRARGVEALLCEGGPGLNSALLRAGAIDELFLTMAARLGADEREPGILRGAIDDPPALALRGVLEHDGELFLRYRVGGQAR